MKKQLLICAALILAIPSAALPATDDAPVSPETAHAWSQKFRGWHYWPDHVIPASPKIDGFVNILGTDVPTVYQIPGDKKWYMAFVGFNGQGYQSFVAESDDLIHWKQRGLAMGFGKKGEFDYGGRVIGAFLYESYDLQAPRVLKKWQGKYWTLYGAYPHQGGYELPPGSEGLASSEDGLTWQRAKDTPILAVTDPDCRDWEKHCIYQPWLVEHNGAFYNFYNAANAKGREQSGLATSKDLRTWTRFAENPILKIRPGGYDGIFSSDPKVFRDGDHWTMFYFGLGHGAAHIMVAFSRDLVHWTADPEPLYKAGGNPSGIDKEHAHKISIVYNPANETYYLFYNAVPGEKAHPATGGRGIGLITSKPLHAGAVATVGSAAVVEHLRCEYRVNPLGIDVVQPRLSWEMRDARRGAKQTAYQVLVASTAEKLAANEGDLWDSGKVAGNQSSQIVYAGKPLKSRASCHWKVRIWDAEERSTAFSSPALWTMGLLKPSDVKGQWIGMAGSMLHPATQAAATREPPPPSLDGCSWIWAPEPGTNPTENASAGVQYFRKTFEIPPDKKIRQARLVIAADDIFSAYLNNSSALSGTDWKLPRAGDVTDWLVGGKNTFAIGVRNSSQSPAGLVGKLIIDYQDGDSLVVPIDASWKCCSTKPDTAWKTGAFDDSKWPNAVETAKMGDKPWGRLTVKPKAKPQACPLFRKEFQVAGNVRRATLYGSALGNYRLSLNGRPVGDDYFTPDWTDYNKRVYYNTYDVTDLVRSNATNAIGGVLAAGWYAGAIGWGDQRNHYGGKPWLFAQLEIELADGSIQTIATDNSWKTSFGPYLEGEFLAGEVYDATREMPGWNVAGFTDNGWQSVAVKDAMRAQLQAFPGVTVQQTGELPTVKITEPKPNVYVFDLGQNFAGFARLKARGPAGTKITLRFAEVLNPDGTIYTKNLRGARATDAYVLRGEGEEAWQPLFTFHGFRYVEVAGYPGRPTPDAITGIAINSKIPLVGRFECSSPMVNRLYQNIVWTQRANFISVPTDCPQRDERLGWTGDAQTFCRAATYNADVAAFFTKWLVDLEDAQGPTGDFPDVAPRVVDLAGGVAAWADAGTICPCTIYYVYNDRRLLAKHYDAMQRWIEYCRKNSTNLLRPDAGFGDWLSINADTPKDVLATAYFAESTRLTAKAAMILNKPEDAEKYQRLFGEIKDAFNQAYVSADGRIKGNTQTCYALALAFDLLPPDKREIAVRRLVEDIRARGTRLSTGFVGTSLIMNVLTEANQTPLAYELFLSDKFPSWGFSIKHGATSIWERWDGWTPDKGFQDPGMNSFAHYSFGAVGRWMFQTIAGIDTAAPGFQQLLIRPQPAQGLDWVKASYDSIHGPIHTEWRKKDGQLTVEVTIPANTTATVCLPTRDPHRVLESDRPAASAPGVSPVDEKQPSGKSRESRFLIGAGSYRFSMPWDG